MPELLSSGLDTIHRTVTWFVVVILCQVLVIDKGHIVERGTHKDLITKEGVYKKLVIRQLSSSDKERPNMDDFNPSLLEPRESPIPELGESYQS